MVIHSLLKLPIMKYYTLKLLLQHIILVILIYVIPINAELLNLYILRINVINLIMSSDTANALAYFYNSRITYRIAILYVYNSLYS